MVWIECPQRAAAGAPRERRAMNKRGGKFAFYVYMHCKPDGTLFYVGKGSGKRARDFASRNQHYKNIVAQYGRENILVSVIPCESDAHACSQEIQLIKAFREIGYELVNKTDGGEGLGTKTALAAAKARGTRLGGRRVSAERWTEIGFAARVARTAEADKRAADLLPVIQSIQAAGAQSLRQIAAGLNERNITTPRRGEWSAVQVQRALRAARGYQVNHEHQERLRSLAQQKETK
jgi:hypothetical protein